jgi:hypothetical protein
VAKEILKLKKENIAGLILTCVITAEDHAGSG